MTRRLRVGVIFGGRSVEHEVSLMSAKSVMDAIDGERFEVVPIGITRSGGWLTAGDPLRRLMAGEVTGEEAPRPALPGVASGTPGVPAAAGRPAAVTGAAGGRPLDVVFPLVHGVSGEDGTLQGLLESADVAYVGAGVLGSALGMDKDSSRRLFRAAGLPVVPWRLIRHAEWARGDKRVPEGLVDEFGLPCFVKPSGSGSSVGVRKVTDERDLVEAIDAAFEFDRRVLVERAVDAREIEVAVLGNDEPLASVPGEIVPSREFYDYRAKYQEASELLVPAPLEPDQADEARRLSLEAFRILDLSGLARVDFFLDRKSGKIILNEVNSLPGFTPVSMYPRLWQESGVPYPELISRLIDLAIERHKQRKALKTSMSDGVLRRAD